MPQQPRPSGFDPGRDHRQAPRSGSAPILAATPGVVVIGLVSFMVWLVLVNHEGAFQATPLGRWMALDLSLPAVVPGLLHPLLHVDVLHLAGAMAVLLWVGRKLEGEWGTPRFLAFFAIVNVSSALVGVALAALGAGAAADAGGGPPTLFLYGGGATALAALVVGARRDGERSVAPWLPRRYFLWIVLLVASTALVLLDVPDVQPRVFLLPQLSGILVGWLFARSLPLLDRHRAARTERHRRIEEERVRGMRRRVDELLEKIQTTGLASLSPEERAFLERASRHYGRAP